MSRGSQSTVAVVVLARLQWSLTELAYFSLSTCPGESTHTLHPAFYPMEFCPTLVPISVSWQTRALCSVGMRRAMCGSTMSGTS